MIENETYIQIDKNLRILSVLKYNPLKLTQIIDRSIVVWYSKRRNVSNKNEGKDDHEGPHDYLK